MKPDFSRKDSRFSWVIGGVTTGFLSGQKMPSEFGEALADKSSESRLILNKKRRSSYESFFDYYWFATYFVEFNWLRLNEK